MAERSFVESPYETYRAKVRAEGYGKPEIIIDKTKLIPFFAIYLSSISFVLSVVTITLVLTGR